jgi:hypothetical protein
MSIIEGPYQGCFSNVFSSIRVMRSISVAIARTYLVAEFPANSSRLNSSN